MSADEISAALVHYQTGFSALRSRLSRFAHSFFGGSLLCSYALRLKGRGLAY